MSCGVGGACITDSAHSLLHTNCTLIALAVAMGTQTLSQIAALCGCGFGFSLRANKDGAAVRSPVSTDCKTQPQELLVDSDYIYYGEEKDTGGNRVY